VNYTRALKLAHIILVDREDEMVWDFDPFGAYTPKMGYVHLNLDLHHRESEWWWKGLWKLNFPPKSKLFLWCLLVKKVPTWEI
jgi:hypothetical protein